MTLSWWAQSKLVDLIHTNVGIKERKMDALKVLFKKLMVENGRNSLFYPAKVTCIVEFFNQMLNHDG
jgi:hypothetical protein